MIHPFSNVQGVSHLANASYPSKNACQPIIGFSSPFIRISYLSMDWANSNSNDDQKKIPDDSCYTICAVHRWTATRNSDYYAVDSCLFFRRIARPAPTAPSSDYNYCRGVHALR